MRLIKKKEKKVKNRKSIHLYSKYKYCNKCKPYYI